MNLTRNHITVRLGTPFIYLEMEDNRKGSLLLIPCKMAIDSLTMIKSMCNKCNQKGRKGVHSYLK